MSRSRRKSPVHPLTTARSDKPFKRIEHGRERVAMRTVLTDGDGFLSGKAFGNPWHAQKDGKVRFDPRDYPHLMRK